MRPYRPKLRTGLAVGLVLAVSLSACRQGEENPPSAPARHVVVIVIDTLRADHLSTYGYDKETTPFLDALATSSTVFTHAVTTSSFTAEAVSSLFTGLYPSASSWGGGWYARPAPDKTTLATAFREAGYATAMFSNSPVLDSPEFYRGFDTTYCFTEFGVSGQGPRLVEKAVAWLSAHRDQPTFTYLHFLDPHSPFTPPEGYARRFGDAQPERSLGLYEDVRENVPALRATGFGPGDPRFDDLVQRYDGEIAYEDEAIQRFFAELKRLGMDRNTLAVVTADHGEEFLDHGFVEHAWTLYPEVHQIPLLLWQPGRLPAERVDRLTSLVDLMPTLFDLQSLPVPEGLSGSSIVQPNGDQPWEIVSDDRPRIMEMLIQSRSLVRAVVTKDSLYIAYWKWLAPEDCSKAAVTIRDTREALLEGSLLPVDTWGPIVHEEFYDRTTDPRAQRDLATERPEAVARYRSFLLEYGAACPPQLSDRFKATRDPQWLSEAEKALLHAVPAAFLKPTVPEDTHDHALEALGYL